VLEGEVRLLAAGTHPCSWLPIAVTDAPRYEQIARECPWATRWGMPSGLHVHVRVADPVELFAVYDAARSFLPELAAFAVNSPFFEGADTGLASARLKLVEDLPRAGIPPAFGSWQGFTDFLAWGVRGRLFSDLTYLWWDLRPRPDFATLEFRVADAQTTVAEVGAVAAFCQALVAWQSGIESLPAWLSERTEREGNERRTWVPAELAFDR
jgi:glutamate---cysteine ligase / carboxylate-amine ligase